MVSISSFELFISYALSLNNLIGNVYDMDYIDAKGGMNIIRVAVYSAVPLLSFIYRKEINAYNNKLLNISINFSLLSFLFMIIASFGAANLIGRLGVCFEPFIHLSLPWIIYTFLNKRIKFQLFMVH